MYVFGLGEPAQIQAACRISPFPIGIQTRNLLAVIAANHRTTT